MASGLDSDVDPQQGVANQFENMTLKFVKGCIIAILFVFPDKC